MLPPLPLHIYIEKQKTQQTKLQLRIKEKALSYGTEILSVQLLLKCNFKSSK